MTLILWRWRGFPGYSFKLSRHAAMCHAYTHLSNHITYHRDASDPGGKKSDECVSESHTGDSFRGFARGTH